MKRSSNSVVIAAMLMAWFAPVGRLNGDSAEVNVRWGLNNEREFFREIHQEDGAKERVFQMNLQKLKDEGAEECGNPSGWSKRQDFCEGMASRIAPVFDFAFSDASNTKLTLYKIEVECFKTGKYRDVGWSKDFVAYDLPLPAAVGVKPYDPPKQLYFTGNGALKLRMWPAFQGKVATELELEIRFHFHADNGERVASTGRMRLRF